MATSEEDIVAVRTRIVEGDVPWNRASAVRQAIESAKAKREARRQRRNRMLLMAFGLLLALLAVLGWLLTRR